MHDKNVYREDETSPLLGVKKRPPKAIKSAPAQREQFNLQVSRCSFYSILCCYYGNSYICLFYVVAMGTTTSASFNFHEEIDWQYLVLLIVIFTNIFSLEKHQSFHRRLIKSFLTIYLIKMFCVVLHYILHKVVSKRFYLENSSSIYLHILYNYNIIHIHYIYILRLIDFDW